MINLGVCTNTFAELWGAFWVRCFSRNTALKYVVLEIDSSCVMHYISNGVPNTHVYSPLVLTIRKLIDEQDWYVEMSQIYREANCFANKLAK